MFASRLVALAIVAVGVSFSTAILAAEPAPTTAPRTERNPGAGISIGPFRLLPTLGLSLGYDDNVTLASHDKISSVFTRLSPGIRLEGGNERRQVALSYQGELATYSDSGRDDYNDHRLRAQFLYSPVLRHAFALDAGIAFLHDQRGTAAREGDLGQLNLDPDRYRQSDVGGRYRFGAPGARGRVELEGRLGRVEYRNNEAFTEARDRDDRFVAGAFFWRVAPKTSALFRVEHGSYDYDTSTLDNVERHYYVGVEVDATAKTTGSLLVGRASKNFDDPLRADFSGTSWRASAQWRPRTYSVFDLSTGRDTDETNGFGDFILRKDVTLGWSYNWSDRFRTTLDGGYANEQHRPDVREDDVNFYGVAADYAFRRWLRFGASWRAFDRSSDVPDLDYNRNLILLTAEASL